MALSLKLNEPVSIALTRLDPKPYHHPGRQEPTYMYSIMYQDGSFDKAFLTPPAFEAISQLQIQPREFFSLCKRKTPQGAEYFEVQTSAKPSPPPRGTPAPIPVHRTSNSATPASAPVIPSLLMGDALIAAIDAVKHAEAYARSNGIPVEFGPQDVRALAATLYIQASKDPQQYQFHHHERAA